jgi:hypothetical protein
MIVSCWKYYPDIYLENLRETTKILGFDIR